MAENRDITTVDEIYESLTWDEKMQIYRKVSGEFGKRKKGKKEKFSLAKVESNRKIAESRRK